MIGILRDISHIRPPEFGFSTNTTETETKVAAIKERKFQSGEFQREKRQGFARKSTRRLENSTSTAEISKRRAEKARLVALKNKSNFEEICLGFIKPSETSEETLFGV